MVIFVFFFLWWCGGAGVKFFPMENLCDRPTGMKFLDFDDSNLDHKSCFEFSLWVRVFRQSQLVLRQ